MSGKVLNGNWDYIIGKSFLVPGVGDELNDVKTSKICTGWQQTNSQTEGVG